MNNDPTKPFFNGHFDSSRKRGSGCLLTSDQSSRHLFTGETTGPLRFAKGSLRKTRRFTETGTNRLALPLFNLNDRAPVDSFTPAVPRSSNRRSSLHAPKTTWPGYDVADYANGNVNGNGNFAETFGEVGHDIPHMNNIHDFDAWELDRTFSPTDLSNRDVAFNDAFQPLKSDIRYRFDFRNLVGRGVEAEAKTDPPLEIQRTESSESYSKKGAWTKEEDELLMKYGNMANAKNWTEIAENIAGRTAKQCRERWCFNLDPTIKKDLWTPDEDGLLVAKQVEIGNKWAQIAQLLPGRTENAVKTRYKSIVRARKREWRPEEDELLLHLQKTMGANWEAIAGQLEAHRTKHAVKMRFKELQAGLINVSLPEYGSARQTVREAYYPQANLQEVSDKYKKLASGETAFSGVMSMIEQEPLPNFALNLKSEDTAFDRTFDDLYSAMYGSEEALLA